VSGTALRLPPRADIEAELARKDLRTFVEKAWPLVEPDTEFRGNWHIDVLCDVLQQVTDGDIKRLIINVSPGCSKSLMVSVFWPAWEWATNPALRYLTASYGSHLTIRDNLRLRTIVTSPWYQRHFPLQLADAQKSKVRFNTSAGGWRIASSVGGVGTGEHPDRIIIDDPTTAEQSRSDLERQRSLDWFDQTVSSRGIARDVRTVVIMQRLHEQDLSGHLLAKGGWEHICWPMRYEPDCADPLDIRTEAGELFWPELFPETAVKQLEYDLGPFAAAGQLQQRPAPEGGGLFRREWFDIVDVAPTKATRCRGWDTAATEGGGDYTVGVKIAQAGGLFCVEDVQRVQYGPDGVDALFCQMVTVDGKACRQREEQEPGSSGKAVIANRTRTLAGFDYAGVNVTGDKVTRARPFRAQCEAGNVKLVRGEWNEAYLQELSVFPAGAHDDQVDASSAAFNELTTGPRPVRVRKAAWG